MDNITVLAFLQNLTPTNISYEQHPLLLPPEVNESDSLTVECAHKIIAKYGETQSLFLYHYVDDIVDRLRIESRTVLRLNKDSCEFHKRPVHFITLVVDNWLAIKTYLDRHYYTRYFNAYAKFLVIYRGKPDRIHGVFQLFHTYGLAKVVVISVENVVYATKYACFNTFQKPSRLFDCNSANLSVIADIYGQHVAVEDCTIKVLSVPSSPYVILEQDGSYSGFEIFILLEAAKWYKFKLSFVASDAQFVGYQMAMPRHQKHTGPHQYNGLLKHLEQKVGDVAVGMLMANISTTEDFAATTPYMDVYYNFYMSIMNNVKQRDKTSAVFTEQTWKTIFLSVIFFIVTTYVLIKLFRLRNAEGYNRSSYAFIQFWGISIKQAVRQPTGLSTRIIFMTFTIFTYIFISTYESTLTSYLMQSPEYRRVRSMRELGQSELTPMGDPYVRDTFFLNHRDRHYRAVAQRWRDCTNFTHCLTVHWFREDFALFADSKHFNNKFHGVDWWMQKINAFHQYVWIVVNKGSGFEKLLNNVIQQIQCTGILNKWVKLYGYTYTVVFEAKAFVPLKLEHVYSILALYLFGIFVAVCRFLYEIGACYAMPKRFISKVIRK